MEEIKERDIDTMLLGLETIVENIPLTNEQRIRASKIINKLFNV